jgi:hypothetical protein
MTSSWMLCSVAPIRTDVSEELSALIIRVTRIGELGTTLAVTSYGVCYRAFVFMYYVSITTDITLYIKLCS